MEKVSPGLFIVIILSSYIQVTVCTYSHNISYEMASDSEQEHRIVKRESCNIKDIKFTHCHASKDEKNRSWYLNNCHNNYFELIMKKGCTNANLKFEWVLKKMSSGQVIKRFKTFNQKSILPIRRHVLKFENYTLEVHITDKISNKVELLQCWIRVLTGEPVPVLLGGNERNALNGTTVLLDGSYTVEAGVKDLQYKWKCTTKKRYSACDNLHSTKKNTSLLITGDVGDTITVTLNLTTKNDSKTLEKNIVVAKPTAPIIEIKCEKNCPGKGHLDTDPATSLFLRVYCYKNCDNKDKWDWKITPDDDLDLNKTTIFGIKSEKLMLIPYSLKYSTNYEIHVKALYQNNVAAKAMMKIRTSDSPSKGGQCTITPNNGTSLKQVFEINCSGFTHNRPLSYSVHQIYQRPDDLTVIFLTQDTVPKFNVRLSLQEPGGDQRIQVRVEDDTMIFRDIRLLAKVEPLLTENGTEEQINEILGYFNGDNEYVESIETLGAMGRTNEAVQIISCLLSELDNARHTSNEWEEFKEDFHYKLLEELLKFPFDSGTKGIISLLPKFVNPDKPKKLEISVLKAKLCNKLAKHVGRVTINSNFPLILGHEANLYTSHLIESADYLLDGNYAKRQGFEIPTKKPISHHLVEEEDYPNYNDDVSDDLRQLYRDLTENAIETLQVSAHAFSMTLAFGENSFTVGDNTLLRMQLDRAGDIYKRFSIRPGVSIKLPRNLGYKKNANVRLLVMSFNQKAFFWDETVKRLTTRIIDMSIYAKEEKPIELFPEYIHVYMNKTGENERIFYSSSVTVPTDLSKWVQKYIDYSMAVHRVEITNGSNFLTQFRGISPVDRMQIVIIKGRRPTYDDFTNAQIVTGNDTIEVPPAEENTWYYVAVLPQKSDVAVSNSAKENKMASFYRLISANTGGESNFTLNYEYSFITQSCVEWKNNGFSTANCRLGNKTTAEMIHCQCKSISKLAGFADDASSKRDDVKEIKFKIQLVYSFTVHICTFLVFLFYCIALCFAVLRVGHKRLVYFLGDNRKHDRYAYFLIIRTEKHHTSSTTSNVIIRLHGDEDNSKPHVLNYPDPDKKILQLGNEDWFILATKQHLGNLTHIEIWFDSIGYRPTWYCQDVRIYDFQSQGTWYFDIKKWFTVLEPNHHYFTVEPSEEFKNVSRSTLLKYFQMYYGKEHTWNIFNSAGDYNFHYVERITILLSHIVCTYIFALIFVANPRLRLSDGFDKTYLYTYFFIAVISVGSSVMSFTLNTLYTFLFRNSVRENDELAQHKKLFPKYTIRITWIFLIATVIIAMTYLIVFGFWISWFASYVWLTITFIALLFSIFVLENFYLSLYYLIRGVKAKQANTKVNYNFAKIIEETESQRHMLYSKLSGYGLRPYLTHLYQPLNEDKIIEKRRKGLIRISIGKSFIDMVVFLVYMFFLYVLLVANVDSMSAIYNRHMRDMIEGEQFGDVPLEDISKIEDIYLYLISTLIPTIHSYNWYGKWDIVDPGLMEDFNTKVLGVARLRQIRVRRNCCRINTFAADMNITSCKAEMSASCEDQESYGKEGTMWYYNPPAAGFFITYGEIGIYQSGGYIVNLGRNLNNAYHVVEMLMSKEWLDKYTRVLFIEFWTYNANRNLFNAVRIIIELNPTGIVFNTNQVFTGRLVYGDIKLELVSLLLFIIFVMIVFYQLIKYSVRIIMYRTAYLTDFWNILDLIILIINIVVICLFIFKITFAEKLLDKLERSKHTEFVNYYTAIYYSETLNIVTAILICIATLRLWRFLRFGFMFQVFEHSLLTAKWHFLGILAYNLNIYLMFSLAGYVLFGYFSENFRNYRLTSTNLMLLCLNINGDFDYNILESYLPTVASVYYTSYMLASLMVLNIFITVIIIHYEESRLYFSNAIKAYTIKDYVYDECMYFSMLWRRQCISIRLRGGEDIVEQNFNSKVYPKSDEHRYADCVFMTPHKLNSMKLIAKGVVYNTYLRKDKTVLTNADIVMMKSIIRFTLRGITDESVKSIFFKGTTSDGKIKFMPDERICKMQAVVEKLLSSKPSYKIQVNADNKEVPKEVEEKDSTLERLHGIEALLTAVNKLIGNISVKIEVKAKHKKHKGQNTL